MYRIPASTTVSVTLPSSGIEVDIAVDYLYYPGSPARTCGDPLDCHDAEPAEVEILRAHGAETGIDVLALLAAETVERRHYPWQPLFREPLTTIVIEDLIDLGNPDEDTRFVRRAA